MTQIDYKHIKESEQGKVTKFWFPDKSTCYIFDKGYNNPKTYVMFNLNPKVIEKCKKAIEKGTTDTYDVGFTRQEINILLEMITKHEKGDL